VPAAILGLALAAALVLDLTAGGPVRHAFHTQAATEHARDSRQRPEPSAAPAPVIAGEHLVRHVPTAAELDARYAAKGLARVGPAALHETSFHLSSFNVLGAIHTSTKGSAHPHWPSGTSRIGHVAALLRSHDISVVGMQELETPQLRALAAAAPEYDVYPGTSVAGAPSDNSIAWRRDDWTLVDAGTTPIPYYGAPVPMPHVLLKNRHTGREVWFANYHNASNDYGNAQGKRDAAIRIEAALVKRLAADGTPVIETGDYNDRQRAACPMMSLAGMHASDGATSTGGSCAVPMRPYPTVDWIFGTQQVSFSGHVADWSTRERQISDHEMIRASVTIAARADDPACVTRKVGGRTLHWCPKPR
jgi:hypothetical protein